MKPISWAPRCEFLRAAKMLLTKGKVTCFRLGYMGVKKKFRRLGLDGVMIFEQKKYAQRRGYESCDIGWILEDNVMVTRVKDIMTGQKLAKIYTVFQKSI
jgi:hypothetical protein